MFFVQGLLLFMAVIFGSIAGNLSYRILNGALATIAEFPYYAFLSPDGETLRCGGAIIEPSIILTAAHCLIDTNFKVYTGIQSLNDLNGRTPYHVKKIIKHPDYSKGSNNDIGLIILSSPIQLGTNAKVIPVADMTPTSGAKVTIVGFGKVKCNPFLVDSAGRCFWGNSRNLRYVNATLTGTNDGVIDTVSDDNRNTCYVSPLKSLTKCRRYLVFIF
ncbi:Trypsin [Oryctes borbonicus]|uniref:Trypsin n=1 Tax=Oryctes borbonicus TaxID=1629725 RepID=A0A0T6BAA9_9SCAR|nr:Trypsin [Oryctes borbonicus]